VVLRASGEKDGEDYDLDSVVGNGAGDGGVVHGKLLLAFSDAVHGNDDTELDRVRAEALDVLGWEAFVDAAGTAASFNSIVRIADATGIPIDEFKEDAAREIMDDLGIEEFSSGPAG
jgi:hypothetical protein